MCTLEKFEQLSPTERDKEILKNVVYLMKKAHMQSIFTANQFNDIDDETKEFLLKNPETTTYGEIVSRLFSTFRLGGNDTAIKCQELGVDSSACPIKIDSDIFDYDDEYPEI